MSNKTVFQIEDVSKSYGKDSTKVEALKNITLNIDEGEFTAIAGPSGSGKSTLLNIMSGLDGCDAGRITLSGVSLKEMKGNELSDFRRDHIGFIFQSYNLLPVLTVVENVEYVMLLQGVDKKERDKRARKIIEDVGLKGMEKRFPMELSGGQQQRVAIARAMASNPDIILADEPTANLDSKTAESLMDLMSDLNREKGITFVFSTHDKMIMERATRLIQLKDGEIDRDDRK